MGIVPTFTFRPSMLKLPEVQEAVPVRPDLSSQKLAVMHWQE